MFRRNQISQLHKLISDMRVEQTQKMQNIFEYVDKTLNVSSRHFDLYAHRSARNYYPLNDGWGLTQLDTGQNFFVNTVDRNITPWIIMGGHWEPNVERVMMSYAQPGMSVIDIGAHFGYYTIKLGTKIGGSGKLLAFEPNPEVNAVCLENIKINALSGHVRLHNHALGDASATATLTRSHSNMASANLIGEQDADFSVEVEVKRLDDVVEPDFTADLIKLDAEGYEKRILDGAADLLRRSPEAAIMIELGLDRWEQSASLDQLLPSCGGNKGLYAVHPDGTLEYFAIEKVRPFLLTCAFHENYFFVAPDHKVKSHVGHLIRS